MPRQLPSDVRGFVNRSADLECLDLILAAGAQSRLSPVCVIVGTAGVRNGDPDIGVTAHRMDERIDTGNILVQRGGIPLPEYVNFDELWSLLGPHIREVVTAALDRAATGCPGRAQDESRVSCAGALEAEYSHIDWSRSARSVHNQVRTFHFGAGIAGPFADVAGERVRVLRTRLTPGPGTRVECADGPIWITEAEPGRA